MKNSCFSRFAWMIALLFGWILSCYGETDLGSGSVFPSTPELETHMDGVMAGLMEEKRVPGAVIAIIHEGKVLFSKGYGFADMEDGTPVDPAQTIFRVGSVSKLFIWTSVIQLAEQDRLSLDADIAEYLDFNLPVVYDDPITLRQLMNHTGGFEDKAQGLFLLDPENIPSLRTYLTDKPPKQVYPPGTVKAYSNYGAALAAYIVERISGLSFLDYVERYILAPLGMLNASFQQPLPVTLAGALAGSYNYIEGSFEKGGFEYVAPYPVGALSTSALDVAKFIIAHLEQGAYGEGRILSPESIEAMHAQSYTADPRIPGMAHGFFEGTISHRRMLYHQGDTFLFHSGLYLIPEDRLGFFISSNSAGGSELVEEAASAFFNYYYPGPRAQVSIQNIGKLEPPGLSYHGEYRMSRSNFTTYEKVFSFLSPVQVSVKESGEILLSLSGEIRRYRQVQEDLFVNMDAPEDVLVVQVRDGSIYLHASQGDTYIKVPWYGNRSFHLLILGLGLIFFILSLIRLASVIIIGLARKRKQLLSNRLLSLGTGIFGLSYLLFLLFFMESLGTMHPVFQVPELLLKTEWPGIATWTILPILLWFSGIALWPITVIAWIRKEGTLPIRIFHSLLTVSAFTVLWSLAYWNILP